MGKEELEAAESLGFPVLFSDEEFEAKVPRMDILYPTFARPLTDTEQLIKSLAALYVGFQHIYDKIFSLWGTYALDRYLHSLVTDTVRENGERRTGFPKEAMNNILKIYNIHSRIIGTDSATVDFAER